MKDDRKAKDLWNDLSGQMEFPVVSVLTIGEILYLSYRAGKPDQGHKMVKGIETACAVKLVDQGITEKAARLEHRHGLPFVDALILATFIIAECKEIHTTDRKHFKKMGREGLRAVFW
jgi:predicted nucleic acid-binding protein